MPVISPSSVKIRIMRICPAPGYLEEFRRHHGLRGKPHAEQVSILQKEGVFLPGGWADGMEALGFEVFDRLYDDFQLNAQWAEENNALHCFLETNPLFSILLEQIKTFEPDIILIWTGGFFRIDRKHRSYLRAAQKKPILLCGFWGDELPHGETYRSYFGDIDFMFTSNALYQKAFEGNGIAALAMGSGFDESIEFRRDVPKKYDVVFCGETGFGKLDHIRRYEALQEIAAKTNIRIFAKEPKLGMVRRRLIHIAINLIVASPRKIVAGIDHVLSRLRFARGGKIAKALKIALLVQRTGVSAASFFAPPGHPRQNYFNGKKPIGGLFPGKVAPGPLDGSKYHELLASAKIVVNIHRDEEADIANIRVFEATGAGAVLLTDRAEEMASFFDTENEIVTFTDAKDCVEKINALLADPAKIARIARSGRARTLRDHTVRKRCELISGVLRDLVTRVRSDNATYYNTYVYATWDTSLYPISYDIAFFVEAAEIYRKKIGAAGTIINILYPQDIKRIKGVSAEADRAVDLHGRAFRITHVSGQVARMFANVTVNEIRDRDGFFGLGDNGLPIGIGQYIPFPGKDMPHHTEYYRTVNANPKAVEGFTASIQARRYVDMWLANFLGRKRLICISIRDYAFDTQRNSKIAEWKKFIESLDESLYEVVIVPDTDQIANYDFSPLAGYRAFWPACFDVDLRYALYEAAFLNLFVNNGPGTASTLDKKVRLLMFKLLASGVPHCTEEFITWSGFPAGGSPVYATPFQKWVWEDDDFSVIRREFEKMVQIIETQSYEFGGPAAAP